MLRPDQFSDLSRVSHLTPTPDPDFSSTDLLTYQVSDGTLASNTATITISVAGANDAPIATADVYSTPEDTMLTVAAAGVLLNDSDTITVAARSKTHQTLITLGTDTGGTPRGVSVALSAGESSIASEGTTLWNTSTAYDADGRTSRSIGAEKQRTVPPDGNRPRPL